MRSELAAALFVLSGCGIGTSTPGPLSRTAWLAHGLGACSSLAPTGRKSVVAACEDGVYEASLEGKHRLHDTLSEAVAVQDGLLWVKLPEALHHGPLPKPGAGFESQGQLPLARFDDLLVHPNRGPIVTTPGQLLTVHPKRHRLVRWRSAEVSVRSLALAPDSAGAQEGLVTLSKRAIHAVDRAEMRPLATELPELGAATRLPDGRLAVVLPGKTDRLGIFANGDLTTTEQEVPGATDLAVVDTGQGPEVWFTTDDGAIGRTPVPPL